MPVTDNPLESKLGSVVTLPLSENIELEEQPPGSGRWVYIRAETFFQMDYRTGEWKRLKKTRMLTPEEIAGIQLCTTSQQPTVVVAPSARMQPPQQQHGAINLHNPHQSNNITNQHHQLLGQQFGQPGTGQQQQMGATAALNNLFQAAQVQQYQPQQQQQQPQFNLQDFAHRQQQPQPGMQGGASTQAVYGVPGMFFNGGNRS